MKALFKNTVTGETKLVDVETKQKRKLTFGGVEWVRVAKEKPKSRATRLSDVQANLESAKNAAEEMLEKVEKLVEGEHDAEVITPEEMGALSFDCSDLDNLKEEMESWRDNMAGTNLESTEKYDAVSEAADNLDTACSSAECISEPSLPAPEKEGDKITVAQWQFFKEELDSFIEELDTTISDADGTEFPGMY